VARLSDERMCRGREFQLLGKDTQKAREAKDDLISSPISHHSVWSVITAHILTPVKCDG